MPRGPNRLYDTKDDSASKPSVREGWVEDAAALAAAPEDPDEADWTAFGNEGDDELTW